MTIQKRGARWPFVFAFILGCALVESCFGAAALRRSPLLAHSDQSDQREFQEVYSNINNTQLGATDGSSPVAGYIGEVLKNGGVGTPSNVWAPCVSLSVTPGSWRICSGFSYQGSSNSVSAFDISITSTSGVPGLQGGLDTFEIAISTIGRGGIFACIPPIEQTTTKTWYMNCIADNGTPTVSVTGLEIWAERRR